MLLLKEKNAKIFVRFFAFSMQFIKMDCILTTGYSDEPVIYWTETSVDVKYYCRKELGQPSRTTCTMFYTHLIQLIIWCHFQR